MACGEMYRKKMAEYCWMTCLDVAHCRIHRQFFGQPGASMLERAERATPAHSLAKLTVARGKPRKFREIRPVLTHPSKSRAREVWKALKSYRETLSPAGVHLLNFYRGVDVAFKIVGTGSVGLHDYVALHFAGDGVGDPLFLQVKEAVPSAYAPYLKSGETGIHQGERVVHGQRMLQAQPDILLGWTAMGKADYLVRQLNDHKGAIENADLRGAGLTEYATTCGEVLARGHARSGDPAVLAGYLGPNDRFDRALGKFALSYAEQTTRDYEGFKKAVRAGKVKVGRAWM